MPNAGHRLPRDKQLKHAEEENTALRLFMAGVPYRDIAEQMGLTLPTAWRRVQRALDNMRPHDDYDKYRGRQLAELAIAREEIMRGIVDTTETTFSERMRACEVLVKVQEREARLIGLDKMPTPAEDIMNMSDAELREHMRQWGLLVSTASEPPEK